MTPAPLLLYDGSCGLCSWWVQQVRRRDRRGAFRFAALESGLGREVLGGSGLQEGYEDSIVLRRPDGRVFTKSGAALRVAIELGWPWRALAAFRLAPPPIRAAVYDVVARHRRRRLVGEACEVGERGAGSGERFS
jgi:predicted DCC family thiol-disulfide oxidoreductase YuxK